MTIPTIVQIIGLLKSNISDDEKTALDLIKSLPTNQQFAATDQFHLLCAEANTNQDGVALIKYARALHTSALNSQDDIGKTTAFYYASVAEYHQQNYHDCIKRLDRTFQEINRITGEQSEHLLAHTHYLYAFTWYYLREYTKAKQHADSALALYQQQQNQTSMTNLNSLAQMISEREVGIPQAPSDETRAEWKQIHAELETTKEELRRVHAQIAQYTESRNTLAQHEQQHLARIQQLQQHQHAKQAEIDALETRITRARERARIWQMAEHIPFWLALIRHEMAQQRISADSLEFLQQLYTLAPQEALATLVEVEARTCIAPKQPYKLDGLHGEVRLFAATANARTLHHIDNTTAISQLVDAWELFLKESI